jgi:hypothetical protein
MKIPVLLATLLLCSITLHAQSRKLSGKLKQENGSAVVGAILTLRTVTDSLLIKGGVSDEQGRFELDNLNGGVYTLSITHIGFRSHREKITINSTDITIPDITLSSNELKAVEVKSQRPLITRSVDKLTVNIEGSVYEKGENSLRLFNVIPGVFVTGNDISFRGTEGVTVFVDNRKVPLTGEALFTYLRSIPSESIRSYDLRTMPGAETDAQNSGVIINITLKSEYRYGLSGNITSGYWYNGNNNVTEAAQLNYRVGKLTTQIGANYMNSPAFYKDEITQDFKSTGVHSQQTEDYLEKYNTISVNAGLDYKLTERQTIGGNYNMFTNPGDFDNTTTTDIKYPDSSLHTKNSRDFSYTNHMANVFYRNRFDSLGSKIDVGYNYIYYKLHDPASIETMFFNESGMESDARDSLFTENTGKSTIHAFNLDVEKYFSKSLLWTIGSKYTMSKTDYTMDYRNGLAKISPLTQSDRFIYDEKILAFYSTIAQSFNSWQVKLGLRAEHTDYTGNSFSTKQTIGRNRWDLFPSAYVNRKIGDDHSLTLSYSRRIDRPGFRQLNPFRIYTSLNNVQEGNPNLLPYYSDNLQLEYLLKNKYTFTVGYQHSSDAITSNVINVGDTIISRDENINNNGNVFLSVYVPIKLTNWWEININATARYNMLEVRYTPVVERSKFSQMAWAVSKFNLPGKVYFEVSGVYSRNNFSGIYDAHDIGKLDFAVKKSFLKDRLTARVEVQDPFHLFKPGSTINTAAFTRIVNREKINWARYAGIWLTYNFSGGKKQTNRENVDPAGNDAKNRL